MSAIFKRELKSYFNTVTGPLFFAVLMAFTGIFFWAYNMMQGYPYFSAALSSISVVLLLLVPILTMRSFSEEQRNKTDQLLLTSPVSVTQITLGKFLSMAAVLGITCLFMIPCPVIIHFYGNGAFVADLLAIIEFFLMGCAFISIGMFISSLTENQIMSAVGTFAILLALQLADSLSSMLSSTAFGSYACFFVLILAAVIILYIMTKNILITCGTGIAGVAVLTVFYFLKQSSFEGLFGTVLSSMSLAARFDSITSQSFEISAIVYYITIAGFFIFLTVQSIQKRRWR